MSNFVQLKFAINRYNEDNDRKGFEFVKVIKAAYEHCCLLLYVTFEAKQGGDQPPESPRDGDGVQVRSNPRITEMTKEERMRYGKKKEKTGGFDIGNHEMTEAERLRFEKETEKTERMRYKKEKEKIREKTDRAYDIYKHCVCLNFE